MKVHLLCVLEGHKVARKPFDMQNRFNASRVYMFKVSAINDEETGARYYLWLRKGTVLLMTNTDPLEYTTVPGGKRSFSATNTMEMSGPLHETKLQYLRLHLAPVSFPLYTTLPQRVASPDLVDRQGPNRLSPVMLSD